MGLLHQTVPTGPLTAHLELRNVSKRYGEVLVLENLSLRVRRGEFVAVSGASGAGKTTLLGIVGLLETMSSGTYYLDGKSVHELGDAERSRLRNRTFGFVFQGFSLIPNLNAWQNAARPLVYAGVPKHAQKARAMALLEQLDLAHRAAHRPSELSGGEQQRLAIARALVNEPEAILADEPTGNLPQAQWQPILDVLLELNATGKTVILVTHNPEVTAFASRRFVLEGGQLQPLDDRPAPGARPRQSELTLRLLGTPGVRYRGNPLPVSARQLELLALLAKHPEGLSGEALLLLSYGERGNPSALKAALSRLRARVPVASQPYRLDLPFEADACRVEAYLRAGETERALDLYRGPLLPTSGAPGIAAWRETLEEALRRAVLASNDGALIYRLAERLTDDLELWERAAHALAPDDPRQALARAHADRLKRDW
jgi:putative ABC transport system ATP-binding protein